MCIRDRLGNIKFFFARTSKPTRSHFRANKKNTILSPVFFRFNNLQRTAPLMSFWCHRFNNLRRAALLTSLIQFDGASFQIWWTAGGYGELCLWFQPIRNGEIFWIMNYNKHYLTAPKYCKKNNVVLFLIVGVAYKVTVKTGAKKNGGTDAKVRRRIIYGPFCTFCKSQLPFYSDVTPYRSFFIRVWLPSFYHYSNAIYL